MYSFFFGILQKIMFIMGLHWFFTAIIHLGTISSLALIGAVILVFLAYRYLENLKKCYHYMMRHKVAIMIAVIVFQLAMLLSAQLLIRRDAAVVFNGAFKYSKETSISSYLTRNPNNLFLFLYERFFYNIFGSSALWILQGLNIFYADITALILYKGMKKYVSESAADVTFSLYVLLVGFSPYFYSMYTDIWPLPLIALQIFLLFDLFGLRWQDKRVLFIKTIGLGLISGLACSADTTNCVDCYYGRFYFAVVQKGMEEIYPNLFHLSPIVWRNFYRRKLSESDANRSDIDTRERIV